MKITQGYTLSQFVDNCEHQTEIEMAISYMDIVKYNNFLKQPLSKDMFVNPIRRPEYSDNINHTKKMFEYKMAEKKVIIHGFIDGDYFVSNNIRYHFKDMLNQVKTIGDLFEYTEGNLKLKNVEL